MSAAIQENVIEEAVIEIFSTMLGLQVETLDPSQDPPKWDSKVTASVGLTGKWNGAVLMECSTETGCLLAGSMLGIEFDSIDDGVKDVLGELSNMLAGSVSRCLEGSPVLSPPCICQGTDYSLEILKATEIAHRRLSCQGQTIIIKVLHAA